MVLLLLAIGTGHDLWRARRPPPAGLGGPPAAAPGATPPDRSGATWPGPARDDRTVHPASRTASDSAAAGLSPSDRAVAPIDLNRALASELDALPGIGPVLARRIVEHRTRHGPFRRVEELRAVRGVGPRLLARLRPHLRVEGTPEGS